MLVFKRRCLVMNDEELLLSFAKLLDIGESRLDKLDEKRLKDVMGLYKELERQLEYEDAMIKVVMHEPVESTGYVEVDFSYSLQVSDMKKFCMAAQNADTMDIILKSDDIIGVIFGFNGLMRK